MKRYGGAWSGQADALLRGTRPHAPPASEAGMEGKGAHEPGKTVRAHKEFRVHSAGNIPPVGR